MRRPAAIGERSEPFATFRTVIANPEIAGNHEDLFPIVMLERNRRIGARIEPQKPGMPSFAVVHIQRARKNFLLDASRIPGRRLPTLVQIELVELPVFLVHCHLLTLLFFGCTLELRAVCPDSVHVVAIGLELVGFEHGFGNVEKAVLQLL